MTTAQFIQAANVDVGYNEPAKAAFLKESKKILKKLADSLGLVKGEYDLRVNQGGIAVSGEVTLHTDRIYVQFSQMGGGLDILYRSCINRKDYTGGPNRWMQWANLQDWDNFVDKIRMEMRK